MWFKNIFLFQFTEPFTLSPDELENDLKRFPFQPCGTVEARTEGWVPPSGQEEGPLVHAANGKMMLCLKSEEKVVPASVLRDWLKERIAEVEEKQGRKVRKQEREQLKDEVYQALLARAFCRSNHLHAYIDPQAGWLVVNSSSPNKAEALTQSLRKSIGSLKIALPKVESIGAVLTQWIKTNAYPAEFVIQDNCVITDSQDGGSIRCQRQNLLSEEIQSLLEGGRFVSQLALAWQEQVAFSINDQFAIKSLRFLELVQDQANDIYAETAAAKFDADFTIMVGVITELLKALFEIFGQAKTIETTVERSEEAEITE